ncbi:hypothetical protein GCM10011391_17720 [Pullulanibacillus camelliae]|uniref:DUF2164 domain-containing protein n=1 Tax=Pullulanibacillus camelliae TaxID=1707096 RepID=A0A8J2YH03_9BACL|nr:DUF2164 domain-containing protein [Pullulanibacillus camelliae]GGE39386.1 hypothetical protein GCM10011391_17720 [Pullulanibacillus camelliae]
MLKNAMQLLSLQEYILRNRSGCPILSKEVKEAIIEKLQSYFYSERGEELGLIGAENLYDFFIKEFAPYVYNEALLDARNVAERQMESLNEELYVLEKTIKHNR